MKDGIGFIMFLPDESFLVEFEQSLKTSYSGGTALFDESLNYVNNTELVDEFLNGIIEAYEKEYGVID